LLPNINFTNTQFKTADTQYILVLTKIPYLFHVLPPSIQLQYVFASV